MKYMVLDWLNFILEFDFYVIHKKGIDHVLPDVLSRIVDKNEDKLEVVLDIWDLEVDREFDLGLLQSTSSMLKELTGKVKPPKQEKKKIVLEKHRESQMGAVTLFQLLFCDGYFWKGMRKECDAVVKGCEKCLKYNVGRAGFHPVSYVEACLPFDHLAINFLGPFKVTEEGFCAFFE